MSKKAQAVYCKCQSIVAACMEPHCHQDKSWQKDIREYSKKGYRIEMIDPSVVRVEMAECKCEPKLNLK